MPNDAETSKILIIGVGGHAQVILDILQYDKNQKIIGFTDIDNKKTDSKIMGYPVLGNDSIVDELNAKNKINSVILGIGYELLDVREKIYNKLKDINIRWVNAIHPNSVIAKTVTIGVGVTVMAGAIINPNSILGNNVVINTGAIIDHDSFIGDNVFVQIGAKIAGNVTIGRNTVIGMGADIKEKCKIGMNSIVGAGSVVLKNVPDYATVGGVPEKILRQNR